MMKISWTTNDRWFYTMDLPSGREIIITHSVEYTLYDYWNSLVFFKSKKIYTSYSSAKPSKPVEPITTEAAKSSKYYLLKKLWAINLKK